MCKTFDSPASRLVLGVAVLTSCFFAATTAAAQTPSSNQVVSDDQIWVAPKRTPPKSSWYPANIETVRGKVSKWDDQQIVITKPGGDQEVIFSSARVVWVQSGNLPASEQKIVDLFTRQDFSGVLSRLSAVLKSRPPVWRQQWLTMLGAMAAHRSGRSKIAIELVAQLDRRPLPLMIVGWLPIDWTVTPPQEESIESALLRLNDPSPLASLVAASWLLGSQHRSKGLETLRLLAGQSKRPAVARLASCLMWSGATPPEVIENEKRWIKHWESLPLTLNFGPAKLLERKLRASGLTQSADALLWSTQSAPSLRYPEWMMR